MKNQCFAKLLIGCGRHHSQLKAEAHGDRPLGTYLALKCKPKAARVTTTAKARCQEPWCGCGRRYIESRGLSPLMRPQSCKQDELQLCYSRISVSVKCRNVLFATVVGSSNI